MGVRNVLVNQNNPLRRFWNAADRRKAQEQLNSTSTVKTASTMPPRASKIALTNSFMNASQGVRDAIKSPYFSSEEREVISQELENAEKQLKSVLDEKDPAKAKKLASEASRRMTTLGKILLQKSIEKKLKALERRNYGAAWKELIASARLKFLEALEKDNSGLLKEAGALLQRARAYREARVRMWQIRKYLKKASYLPENVQNRYKAGIRKLKLYASCLLDGDIEKAQQYRQLYQKDLRKAKRAEDKFRQQEFKKESQRLVEAAFTLLHVRSSENLKVPEDIFKTLDNLIKQYQANGSLTKAQFKKLEQYNLLANSAIYCAKYFNNKFFPAINSIPGMREAFVSLKRALGKREISKDTKNKLNFISRNISRMIQNAVFISFKKGLNNVTQWLDQYDIAAGSKLVQNGRSYRYVFTGKVIPTLTGLRDGAFGKISSHQADARILSLFKRPQDLKRLKETDPIAYRRYMRTLGKLIHDAVYLKNCRTVGDILRAVEIVQFLMKQGHVPSALRSPSGKQAFMQRIINHQVIKNVQTDATIGKVVEYAKATSLAISTTIISFGAASMVSGTIVAGVGGGTAISGTTNFLLTTAITAPILTLANKSLNVAIGTEKHWFRSWNEFAVESIKTFGMLLSTGAVGHLFGSIFGRAALSSSKIARSLFKIGAFTTEIAAFTGWGLGEQAFEAGIRGHKTDQIFSANNIAHTAVDNVVFVLGLKAGNFVANPIIDSARRALIRKVAPHIMPKLEALAQKQNELLSGLKVEEGKITKNGKEISLAEHYLILSDLLSLNKKGLNLQMRLETLGLAEASELKATKQLIKEIKRERKSLRSKLGKAARQRIAQGLRWLRRKFGNIGTSFRRLYLPAENFQEQGNETSAPGLQSIGEEARTGVLTPKARRAKAQSQADTDNPINTEGSERTTVDTDPFSHTVIDMNNTRRQRILQNHPDKAVYEVEAQETAQRIWSEFQNSSQPAKDKINKFLKENCKIEDPRKENPLEIAHNLRYAFPQLLITHKLVKILIDYEAMKLLEARAKSLGSKPEVVRQLFMDEHNPFVRRLRENYQRPKAEIRIVKEDGPAIDAASTGKPAQSRRNPQTHTNTDTDPFSHTIFDTSNAKRRQILHDNPGKAVYEVEAQETAQRIWSEFQDSSQSAKDKINKFLKENCKIEDPRKANPLEIAHNLRYAFPQLSITHKLVKILIDYEAMKLLEARAKSLGSKPEVVRQLFMDEHDSFVSRVKEIQKREPSGNQGARTNRIVRPVQKEKTSQLRARAVNADVTNAGVENPLKSAKDQVVIFEEKADMSKTPQHSFTLGEGEGTYHIARMLDGNISVFRQDRPSDGIHSFRPIKDGSSINYEGITFSRKGNIVTINATSSNQPAYRVIEPQKQRANPVENRSPKAPEIPLDLEGKPINSENRQELRDVEELKHGDMLPPHEGKLDSPESFNKREKLFINLRSHGLPEFINNIAKKVAQGYRKIKTSRRQRKELADRLAILLKDRFHSGQGEGVAEAGENKTIGAFMDEGGCCRHRAAALQAALQSVGIRSRYVRGIFGAINVESGKHFLLNWHAWVEVDVKGDGTFSYLIDPNQGNARGQRMKVKIHDSAELLKDLKDKGLDKPKSAYGLYEGKIEDGIVKFYIRDGYGATVWRAK